ncbi:NfeD family protein [Corynebacterium sp. H128]|uniref:NfeD family protein n=1 Tax=unclassified Corynebacterium TaxID=2624378 RepID=UPI00309608AC
MGTLIWFIVAVVLATAELLAGEFTMLMLAGAALATAGIALADVPVWAEVACFAVCAVALLVFVRPVLNRHMRRDLVLDTSPKALVGQTAEVLESVDAGRGQIRLDGSIWSARSLVPTETFAVGERVHVVSIDGTTAVVFKEL